MESTLILAWKQPNPELSLAEKRLRFGEIARGHQSTLLRIARNYCRNNDALAQDLVQDALVNGYRAYLDGGFREGTNVKAWLVRILTNLFLNDYRRRKKWDAGTDIEEGDGIAAGPGYEPDRLLFEQILDGPIEEALGRLPEHQRMCVTLVDIEGMDYAEAAAILDCPVGTVRSRLARGRTALYEDLVEYGRSRGVVR
ncbi:MAG: sigma-70 family RNA polymerase sigma factor [Fimbriimonadales bacterium]